MRLVLDADNCLVDWQGHWARTYERYFDRRLRLDLLHTWTAYSEATHFAGFGEWCAWADEVDLWSSLNDELVAGAERAVEQLTARGHLLTLATHRPPGGQRAATELAARLGIPRVVFATPVEKATLDADAWVDDAPECLWNLHRLGLRGVRFVCPWNAGAPGFPAHDWPEVLAYVDRLAEELGEEAAA